MTLEGTSLAFLVDSQGPQIKIKCNWVQFFYPINTQYDIIAFNWKQPKITSEISSLDNITIIGISFGHQDSFISNGYSKWRSFCQLQLRFDGCIVVDKSARISFIPLWFLCLCSCQSPRVVFMPLWSGFCYSLQYTIALSFTES